VPDFFVGVVRHVQVFAEGDFHALVYFPSAYTLGRLVQCPPIECAGVLVVWPNDEINGESYVFVHEDETAFIDFVDNPAESRGSSLFLNPFDLAWTPIRILPSVVHTSISKWNSDFRGNTNSGLIRGSPLVSPVRW
jgi:hypothetical protein